MARPGTIRRTRAVEVNIQAVAPESITGAASAAHTAWEPIAQRHKRGNVCLIFTFMRIILFG
jgi:hypothetical protein